MLLCQSTAAAQVQLVQTPQALGCQHDARAHGRPIRNTLDEFASHPLPTQINGEGEASQAATHHEDASYHARSLSAKGAPVHGATASSSGCGRRGHGCSASPGVEPTLDHEFIRRRATALGVKHGI
jgi:hypothetical protein